MAGITLAQAQQQLQAWIEASLAIASGQAYSIGGRSLTRANLPEVNKSIDKWDAKVKELSRGSGGIRVRAVVVND